MAAGEYGETSNPLNSAEVYDVYGNFDIILDL